MKKILLSIIVMTIISCSKQDILPTHKDVTITVASNNNKNVITITSQTIDTSTLFQENYTVPINTIEHFIIKGTDFTFKVFIDDRLMAQGDSISGTADFSIPIGF